MKKKNDNIVKRMLKYFKNIKGYLILISIIMIIIIAIGVINPIVSANLLTSLTEFNTNNIFKYSLLFALISIVKILVTKYHDTLY